MRMKTTLSTAVVSAVLLLAAGPAWAHHAMVAQFAIDKPITLRGTITKMEWVNPHGWIYLDVKGPDGKVEDWKIETGSPLRMQKRGLTKADLRPGVDIIVGGFASRNGTRTAAGWIVTFPDREALYPEREASFPLGR